MQTGSPKVSRIVTMVLFALSCIGLLLFLWLSFGGTMPFNAQGYRSKVAFQNAFDLAVQLDEIFNTFNPQTRAAFRQWQQELAVAIRGNDQNLNNVLGNLPTFAVNLTQLLQVLDIEHSSVVQLVQNGGTTFNALNQDPAALHNLITAGETTFHTTAANNNKLADIFHIFPTFLNEQRLTMAD